MALYRISHANRVNYVIAKTMLEATQSWNEALKENCENKKQFYFIDPDSIEYICSDFGIAYNGRFENFIYKNN